MRQIGLCVALFSFAAGSSVNCLSQTTIPQKGMEAKQMGRLSLRGEPSVKQPVPSPGMPVTATGILLVSDNRCGERAADAPQNKWECPAGFHQFRGLIDGLRSNHWTEPQNMGNPTMWLFHPNSPMIKILQAGPAAEDDLLDNLNDPQIKDHVIFLLGGVGDAKAVAPIIDAMADSDEAQVSEYARKVNLAANLALTNLTVGDVIWHHGGGVTFDLCPDDPKSCWSAWWARNGRAFDISRTANRLYANYPDYGIYQDPNMFRSEDFLPAH